jgi:hypothetical protein
MPREVSLLGASGREQRAPALPAELGSPPEPGESPAPYLEWLAAAAGVLAGRVEANAAELERLAAEWGHVIRNLERLRPEEITEVAESQARVREAIAADRALLALVELQRQQLEGWAEAVAVAAAAVPPPPEPEPAPPPAPPPLVDDVLAVRLLDGAVEERARLIADLFELTGEALAGAVLDLEVVRRESLREPERAAVGLFEVGRRLTGAADGIRQQARAADLRPRADESLPAALRRAAETLGAQLRTTVAWSGPEAIDPRAATAVFAVVEECLRHLATVPGTEVAVAVDAVGAGALMLRVATSGGGLTPAGEPPWLVRSRVRAAVAGARLECAADGTRVELHL